MYILVVVKIAPAPAKSKRNSLNVKKIIIIPIIALCFNIQAAESNNGPMPKHEWSFNGITGTFDRAALQRGFKVYREVCAGCHSMKN